MATPTRLDNPEINRIVHAHLDAGRKPGEELVTNLHQFADEIAAVVCTQVADDLREWAASEPDILVRRGMQIAADIVRTHATKEG